MTPEQFAEAIRHEHKAAQDALSVISQAYQCGLDHVLNAGNLLLLAKDAVEHGEWGRWLKDNFNSTHKTANHWMRLAAHSEEVAALRRAGTTSVRGLLKALAEPHTDDPKWKRVSNLIEESPHTSQEGTSENLDSRYAGQEEHHAGPSSAGERPPLETGTEDVPGTPSDYLDYDEWRQSNEQHAPPHSAVQPTHESPSSDVAPSRAPVERPTHSTTPAARTPSVGGKPRRRANVKPGRFRNEREAIVTLKSILLDNTSIKESLSVTLLDEVVSLLGRIEKGLESALVRDCPPTLEDVQGYAATLDVGRSDYWAGRFYDYQLSTDWQVGHKYMIDWQAAFRDYLSRETQWKQERDERYEKSAAKNGKPNHQFGPATDEDIERLNSLLTPGAA